MFVDGESDGADSFPKILFMWKVTLPFLQFPKEKTQILKLVEISLRSNLKYLKYKENSKTANVSLEKPHTFYNRI